MLGIGKRGESGKAAEATKGVNVLNDEAPMSSGMDGGPVSSGFATPAGMVGDLRAALKSWRRRASGAARGVARGGVFGSQRGAAFEGASARDKVGSTVP